MRKKRKRWLKKRLLYSKTLECRLPKLPFFLDFHNFPKAYNTNKSFQYFLICIMMKQKTLSIFRVPPSLYCISKFGSFKKKYRDKTTTFKKSFKCAIFHWNPITIRPQKKKKKKKKKKS